jgi:hypothetical protein
MNLRETLKSKYSILIFIDILMMLLLLSNLTLILFDWIFSVNLINGIIEQYLPEFYLFYDKNIHQNFESIDLVFVMIFLSEFVLSWILAIIQKSYYKWFFYPILHWYDLAGCIPIGSFRFLRVLRIFSILVRLNNLKVIELSKSYVVIKLKKYYGIIVEEISDRVVVNILEGVQDEIVEGGPVVDDIITKVIKPKQELIVEWISSRIEHAVEQDVLQKKEEISAYVRQLISESLSKNEELKTLELVPVMGKKITEAIQKSISNTINDIIEQALLDLASYKNKLLIKETTDVIIKSIEFKDEDKEVSRIYSDIVIEVLDIVKKQVLVKKWKLKEQSEKGIDETEKDSIEFLMTDD